eukprot:1002158-Amphidinium_carterae.1
MVRVHVGTHSKVCCNELQAHILLIFNKQPVLTAQEFEDAVLLWEDMDKSADASGRVLAHWNLALK